jgi:hypothetical protein
VHIGPLELFRSGWLKFQHRLLLFSLSANLPARRTPLNPVERPAVHAEQAAALAEQATALIVLLQMNAFYRRKGGQENGKPPMSAAASPVATLSLWTFAAPPSLCSD